jgi:hypothetical protein
MPNSIEFLENTENAFYDFKSKNYINLLKETDSLSLWKHFDNDRFDYSSFYNENYTIFKNEKVRDVVPKISTNGINYINFPIKNLNSESVLFLNRLMTQFSNNVLSPERFLATFLDRFFSVSIKDIQLNNLHLKNHRISDIKSLYEGDYYNLNLNLIYSTYNNSEANLIQSLLDSTINSSASTFQNLNLESINDNFKKIFHEEEYSVLKLKNEEGYARGIFSCIYKNRSPIFSFKDKNEDLDLEENQLLDKTFEINNFLLNPDTDIDITEFSLKIDEFVKKQKRNNLSNKEIKADILIEIIQNLKSNKNTKYALSYAAENIESLSVINKDNMLFKLMFTKDALEEKKYYSNFSLNSKNYVFDTEFLSILENVGIESKSDDVKNILDIFSNFFEENFFITSSRFLKEIVSDFVKYIQNLNIDDYNLSEIITTMLYFNYFDKDYLNNSNDTVKKTFAKRIVKKAIQKDTITTSVIKNNSLKEFEYNVDFNQEIEKAESKSELEKIINKRRNSSAALNILSDAIFSDENFESIKEKSTYSQVYINNSDKNSLIYAGSITKYNDDGTNSEVPAFEINDIKLDSVVFTSLLPFVHVVDANKISNKRTEDLHRYKLSVIKDQKLVLSDGEKYEFENLKIIKSKDISYNMFVSTKKEAITAIRASNKGSQIPESLLKELSKTSSIFLQDKFESLVNKDKDIFSIMIEKIQLMLRMSVKDYLDKSVKKEEDIDKIILENEFILDDVITLIELYGSIFNYVREKINLYSSFNRFESYFNYSSIFKIRNNLYSAEDANTLTIFDAFKFEQDNINNFKDLLSNRTLSKYAENIGSAFNSNFNFENNIIIYDLKKLSELYSSDPYEMIQQNIDLSENNTSSLIENQISSQDITISNSVNFGGDLGLTADLSTSSDIISYDFESEFNYDVFTQKINSVFSILLKSERAELLNHDLTRCFLLKIKNINNFTENLFNSDLNEISNYININRKNFYSKINDVFYQKTLLKAINKNNLKIEQIVSNLYLKIPDDFPEEFLLNNNIYDFYKERRKYRNVFDIQRKNIIAVEALHKDLVNSEKSSFIKVTVTPIDIYNNNKVYIPKVYVFSTDITSLNLGIKDGVNSEIISFYEDEDGYINSKVIDTANSSSLSDVRQKIKNLNRVYFKTKASNTQINQITSNILQLHKDSLDINYKLYLCKGIDVLSENNVDIETVTSFFEGISDIEFLEVFNQSKEEFRQRIASRDYSLEKEMSKAITQLMSEKIEIDDEIFDRYLMAVDLENLPFYYKTVPDSLFESYTLSESEKVMLLFDKFDITKLDNIVLYKHRSYSNMNTLNYDIKVEVI